MVKFGSAVLISLSILVYQSKVLFPQGGNGGIDVTWENVKMICASPQRIFIYIVCVLFPVCVLILAVRRKMISINGMFIKSWLMYVIAWAEAYLLIETGDRAGHGNFHWGMYGAGWLLYIYSCMKLLEIWNKCRKDFSALDWVLATLSLILLVASAFSGIVYFAMIIQGKDCLV